MNGKVPIRSAYLGHADPISTYWYLQATRWDANRSSRRQAWR